MSILKHSYRALRFWPIPQHTHLLPIFTIQSNNLQTYSLARIYGILAVNPPSTLSA
jgi:hypothetical protein